MTDGVAHDPGAGTTTPAGRFDRVVVIYNPQSTGEAPRLAEELRADLARRLPATPVRLDPTERAGHARDLAAEAARTARPLIISVSGDGGYNEVVDGVMQAGNPDAVTAVLAAGNANDHDRVVRDRPLVDSVVDGAVRRIDLLRLTTGAGSTTRVRHAHSYIGLGLTPVVAIDREKGGKGSFREIISVIRTFARFRPFTIELEDGTRRSIDSMLFANIAQMAKYATLSETGSPTDGRFEVIELPHTSKWRLLGVALRAATHGLGRQPSATRYRFAAVEQAPLQLDGELLTLDAGTPVCVEIVPAALQTLA
jgi:diacylglycerol kinase (ATP)